MSYDICDRMQNKILSHDYIILYIKFIHTHTPKNKTYCSSLYLTINVRTELICNAFAEHSTSSIQITFKRKKKGGGKGKERKKERKEEKRGENMKGCVLMVWEKFNLLLACKSGCPRYLLRRHASCCNTLGWESIAGIRNRTGSF